MDIVLLGLRVYTKKHAPVNISGQLRQGQLKFWELCSPMLRKAGQISSRPAAASLTRVLTMRRTTTAVLNTRAECVTACDNSCLMHIGGALHRQRTGVQTVHIAEILAGGEA